ncbi:hypothetical protein [Streptomyces sp. NPDC006551]|uniref:hypothetical protein n=1 Tax=Streptomyces sp. NPDC006551 TaxID=3157178 RepID=UPI0033A2FFD5
MTSPFDSNPGLRYERLYVVYEGERGAIVHLHRVLVYEGSEETTEEQDHEQALHLARRMGHGKQNLLTIPVDPRDFDITVRHRVDLDTRRLVPDQPAET